MRLNKNVGVAIQFPKKNWTVPKMVQKNVSWSRHGKDLLSETMELF